MRSGFVYIMTNASGTLYIGVTSDIERRIYEQKMKLIPGFTQRYKLTRLIYLEEFGDIRDAIAREKQLKSWNRSLKIALIERSNPEWQDLAPNWFKPMHKESQHTQRPQRPLQP
jgi:putative endonuclease